ncbi:YheT family hydrolase [Zunongwangia endophytica]|uniref:YheT family hydrolase n=1 Tax=Zunongwangia endophytica TaxID=1808945 RepID=A0ABV8H5B8_9FLAO|nr:alpha/beta fold hydrolase [Zunongwangia endophytica]MDN3596118.1 alpha/beta fold hydrolase [Zunongwangia endophytica]
MPVIESKYEAPRFFKNPHIATIYAATLRKVDFKCDKRERLELGDGDFLDLDWAFTEHSSKKLIIALHGLAGDANRPYMLGMAKIFTETGWDYCGMNFRSCSGEINRLYRSYNAGATEDLAELLSHVLQKDKYDEIALVGFSLGGNLLLKYLGERDQLPKQIKVAVAVSTPCDLSASLEALNLPKNKLYSNRFKKNLKDILYERQLAFPKELEKSQISACNSLLAIDELYTSRAHGYASAAEYYEKCSCLQFLPNIKIPTLLLNAENDSFLTSASFPKKIAENSAYLYLETPKYGGHVGFIQHKKKYYQEERALEFIQNHLY